MSIKQSEEKRELALMTFPRHVNKSDGKTDVKAKLHLVAHVPS
jgi:hypothetical protein